MKTNLLQVIIATIAFGLCGDAVAISSSSLDSFSTSSEGWSIGVQGTQPSRNAGAGFDGQAGFLSHFSDSVTANGKWLMWSEQADWLGNYASAGVTGITLEADNQAGSSLGLRIAFKGPGGWFYSGAQTITNSTAGADWTLLSYALDSGSFTYATGSGGTGIFADTMAGVTRFEIFGGASAITYHSNGNVLDAGTSTNSVGIDHVSAVPEPSVLVLLVAGCVVAAVIRR